MLLWVSVIYSLAFPVSLRESLDPLRAAQAATHMQCETPTSGLAFSGSRRFALVVYELLDASVSDEFCHTRFGYSSFDSCITISIQKSCYQEKFTTFTRVRSVPRYLSSLGPETPTR